MAGSDFFKRFEDPEWMKDAECLGADSNLWFPERGQDTTQAKAICDTCPVEQECLEYAITNHMMVGIYGGKSARQRRAMHEGRS
jgi:WhiB family redox-sensing transcriptional regulator